MVSYIVNWVLRAGVHVLVGSASTVYYKRFTYNNNWLDVSFGKTLLFVES